MMRNINFEVASFKLYWFFGIPSVILSAIYCYVHHSAIFYNPFFILGVLSCIPSSYFIAIQKRYRECLREYSEMAPDELEKIKQEILNTPEKHYAIEKKILKKFL